MKILSPAKINLFLQVTGKRADGYHDLATLMCCVGLYDTVSLTLSRSETTVTCYNPNVPNDKTNLAARAAGLFLASLNKHQGVKIFIEKNIPVAAGLGGGSSNAASVLLGLNRYYGDPFNHQELTSMGLSIGADVPFFIYRKPAIASGIGEKLKAFHGLLPFKIVLVYPGFSVSTADIYKNLDLRLTKCNKNFNINTFNNKDFNVRHHLCNDLETVTVARHQDILSVKDALVSHGAEGTLMSGSGPTVYGLFSDSGKAQRAKHALAKNSRWQVFLADILA
jgi:4-diphosphocytidyl-2-C-methyl-D-erythritol kinase